MTSLPSPSREELVALIRDCPEIRPVGSRTSKSPCFETEGREVGLRSFRQMKRVGPNLVRVGAGVIVKDLLTFLRSENLALPTIGEWHGQTVAGAISTGTHGGSYVHGSLCSSVSKLVLIDGNGREQRFEREDPKFDFILPSFGTTGILVEFELECEPLFSLSLGRRCLRFENYVEDLIHNPQQVEFRSAIWLPAVARIIDYSAKRIRSTAGYDNSREPRFSDTAMVLDWVSRQPVRWTRRASSSALPSVAQISTNFSLPLSLLFPDKHYSGSYEDILAPLSGTADEILQKRKRNRTPPEGEFAVSRNVAGELLRELDRLFRLDGLAPDRPVGLRPGIEENGALSATQEGPSIWVSMFIAKENPLMEILPDILRQYNARPHWGKCIFNRPADVSALYPRWDAFCDFRNELDPNGIFLNAFATDLGISQHES